MQQNHLFVKIQGPVYSINGNFNIIIYSKCIHSYKVNEKDMQILMLLLITSIDYWSVLGLAE